MGKRKKHWTQTMFIDKASIWLHWMNLGWKSAPKIVRQIKKVLKNYNITKGKILELGCGNGRITINLAKHGFDATGVDISPYYIEDAKKKATQLKVKAHFVHGDIRRINKVVRGKFDVAISIWTSLGFYDQHTDEELFKKVACLLKRNGIFLILFTMSRERLLSIFNTSLYQESDTYIVLNNNAYESSRSVSHNKWIFYKKVNKDLIYEDEVAFDLRIYAIPEFVAMAEKAGLAFRESFQSLLTLEPARYDSPANLVFQKRSPVKKV